MLAVHRVNLAHRAVDLLQRFPLATGVGISCVKTSAADLIVQTTVERREHVDWRRNAVFAAFGAGYLGGVQYLLYCRLFPLLFPSASRFAALPLRQKLTDTMGQRELVAQVCCDQLLHIPFLYYPTFYVLKASIVSGQMTLSGTRDALNDYRKVAISDNMAQWCFFAPAATLNFGFSPLWLRVPVVAAVSFLWTMVLSYRRGSVPAKQEEPSRFSEARWRELSMRSDTTGLKARRVARASAPS